MSQYEHNNWDLINEVNELTEQLTTMRNALQELVNRCDGPAGVRADGSNICTFLAHAALGDLT